jgi:rod shape determining protein RodA
MSVTPIQPVDESLAPRPRAGPLFDPILLLAAIGVVAVSLATLKGATSHAVQGHPLFYVERQGLYAAVGIALALILSRFDYSRLRELKVGLFAAMILLNVVVYAMPPVQEAHRWIPLKLLEFQSSEFGKILLIVALSAFAVDRARELHQWRTTAWIMGLALVGALVVIPQPDLGTGMVYVSVGFAILFFAGTSFRQLGALVAMFAASIAIVLAGAPAIGVHLLKGYQLDRLTAFITPAQKVAPNQPDPWYQLQQSEIAIGSGQRTGRGADASQTKLNYLPANDTDFVFAAVGETYGFVGAAVVLSLYALLIWRALRILTMSKNLFGTLIAGGILAMLMFQIFVNVGMTIGIMPVTGVPLPLLSYGGSSVIVTFIAIGLLESIYIQGRRAAIGKGRALLS